MRRVGAGVLGLALVCGLAITAFDHLVIGYDGNQGGPASAAVVAQPTSAVLADEWTDRIQRETTWRAGRNWAPSNKSGPRPNKLQGPPEPPSWFMAPPTQNIWMQPGSVPPDGMPQKSGRSVSGYRTVCVRACDGYFFPISFGASEARLGRDQATCSSACPGAKLYYYKAGSEEPEDMVDLSGQKYSKSKNADLFRTQYNEACKCKPHPWEKEAVERHRVYALEDMRRKGNRAVVAELEMLKGKSRIEQKINNRRSRNEKRRAVPDEEASLSSPRTVAQIQAPRSDVSRGQGGATLSTFGGGQVLPGTVAAAASVATVETVTSTATANAGADHSAREAASANSAIALPAATLTNLPVTVETFRGVSDAAGDLVEAAPTDPEQVEPAPVPRKERSSRKSRRDKSEAKGQREAVAGRGRPSGWVSNVFSQ